MASICYCEGREESRRIAAFCATSAASVHSNRSISRDIRKGLDREYRACSRATSRHSCFMLFVLRKQAS